MSIDSLPPLREVIATHELAAQKSLGQNFLLDLNLKRRCLSRYGINPISYVENNSLAYFTFSGHARFVYLLD